MYVFARVLLCLFVGLRVCLLVCVFACVFVFVVCVLLFWGVGLFARLLDGVIVRLCVCLFLFVRLSICLYVVLRVCLFICRIV